MIDVGHPTVLPTSQPCLSDDEVNAVVSVFDSRWLGTGAVTKQFEDEVASFIGARHVVAVNSGTAALHIALEATGIGSGDEVIVPSFTFVSTIQAILASGARPVFCDVELESGQLFIPDVLSRITSKTRAILPVHYGGSSADMDPLMEIAKAYSLRVIEDAAHAFGSSYRGRAIGTIGDVTCFSFDPIKNITCGIGGAAVTSSDDVAERLRTLSNVGLPLDSWTRMMQPEGMTFNVEGTGYRYRMIDLNAAIGLKQLRKARTFHDRKIAIVKRYEEAFADLPGISLLKRNWSETFPFIYAIRVLDHRQVALASHLRELGIGTTIHFPPNHLQTAFVDYAKPLPHTEQLFEEILTLPLFVDMSDMDVSRVVRAVQSFMIMTHNKQFQ